MAPEEVSVKGTRAWPGQDTEEGRMHHNYRWLLLHDYVLRVTSVERGMLMSVYLSEPGPTKIERW